MSSQDSDGFPMINGRHYFAVSQTPTQTRVATAIDTTRFGEGEDGHVRKYVRQDFDDLHEVLGPDLDALADADAVVDDLPDFEDMEAIADIIQDVVQHPDYLDEDLEDYPVLQQIFPEPRAMHTIEPYYDDALDQEVVPLEPGHIDVDNGIIPGQQELLDALAPSQDLISGSPVVVPLEPGHINVDQLDTIAAPTQTPAVANVDGAVQSTGHDDALHNPAVDQVDAIQDPLPIYYWEEEIDHWDTLRNVPLSTERFIEHSIIESKFGGAVGLYFDLLCKVYHHGVVSPMLHERGLAVIDRDKWTDDKRLMAYKEAGREFISLFKNGDNTLITWRMKCYELWMKKYGHKGWVKKKLFPANREALQKRDKEIAFAAFLKNSIIMTGQVGTQVMYDLVGSKLRTDSGKMTQEQVEEWIALKAGLAEEYWSARKIYNNLQLNAVVRTLQRRWRHLKKQGLCFGTEDIREAVDLDVILRRATIWADVSMPVDGIERMRVLSMFFVAANLSDKLGADYTALMQVNGFGGFMRDWLCQWKLTPRELEFSNDPKRRHFMWSQVRNPSLTREWWCYWHAKLKLFKAYGLNYTCADIVAPHSRQFAANDYMLETGTLWYDIKSLADGTSRLNSGFAWWWWTPGYLRRFFEFRCIWPTIIADLKYKEWIELENGGVVPKAGHTRSHRVIWEYVLFGYLPEGWMNRI